jgi:hypothetical protein
MKLFRRQLSAPFVIGFFNLVGHFSYSILSNRMLPEITEQINHRLAPGRDWF